MTRSDRAPLEGGIKAEIRAAADKELPPDYSPADIGTLPGDGDDYVVTDMRGPDKVPAAAYDPRTVALTRRPALTGRLSSTTSGGA